MLYCIVWLAVMQHWNSRYFHWLLTGLLDWAEDLTKPGQSATVLGWDLLLLTSHYIIIFTSYTTSNYENISYYIPSIYYYKDTNYCTTSLISSYLNIMSSYPFMFNPINFIHYSVWWWNTTRKPILSLHHTSHSNTDYHCQASFEYLVVVVTSKQSKTYYVI